MLSIILLYFCIQSISTISDQNLNINVEYENNQTILLTYNLTTNFSYYLTFRLFGNEQFKYGLNSPTNQSINHSIPVLFQPETDDSLSLFIICFHFLVSLDNLDIQCRDIRLVNNFDNERFNVSEDFLPSYNPLFVPMMYALSIIMLLPVMIQHHRRHQLQSIRRRKELRRLSVSIVQDKSNPKRNFAQRILSSFSENGNLNYESVPLGMKLTSATSTKTTLDDIDDNPIVTFSLQNSIPFTHQYDDIDLTESNIDAHDCIAHLLDNTPWNTPMPDQSFSTSSLRHSVIRDCATNIKEQYVPTIVTFYGGNNDEERQLILNTRKNSTKNFNFSQANRTFFESDV